MKLGMACDDHALGDLVEGKAKPVTEMVVELASEIDLASLGAKLRSSEIRLDCRLQRWRACLVDLANAPGHV